MKKNNSSFNLITITFFLMVLLHTSLLKAKAVKVNITRQQSSNTAPVYYLVDVNTDGTNDLRMKSEFVVSASIQCAQPKPAGLSFAARTNFGADLAGNPVQISLTYPVTGPLCETARMPKSPVDYYCTNYADLSYADYTLMYTGSYTSNQAYLKVKVTINGVLHNGYIAYTCVSAKNAFAINIYAGNAAMPLTDALADMYIYDASYIVYEDIPNTPIADGDLVGTITTGLQNAEDSPLLNVFPNPVNDRLQVEMADASMHYSYALYQSDGCLVKEGTLAGDCYISMQEMRSGIYTLKIYSGDIVRIRKIVKI